MSEENENLRFKNTTMNYPVPATPAWLSFRLKEILSKAFKKAEKILVLH